MTRLLSSTLVSLAFLACKKNAQQPTHVLSNYTQTYTPWVHQAVGLYDSTALYDSLLFVQPPTNRIYEWTVLPDSTGVHFSDDYRHGRPAVSFDHSGDYRISATIYDSATNRELARTTWCSVHVTTDTLYPTTAIRKTDQLTITCCSFGTITANTSGLDTVFWLSYATMDNYPEWSTITYGLTTINGITVSFSDSTSLSEYPWGLTYEPDEPADGNIYLQSIPVGSTQPFAVVWLDQTYSGTVSRPTPTTLTFTWDNSNPVKFTN